MLSRMNKKNIQLLNNFLETQTQLCNGNANLIKFFLLFQDKGDNNRGRGGRGGRN